MTHTYLAFVKRPSGLPAIERYQLKAKATRIDIELAMHRHGYALLLAWTAEPARDEWRVAGH